MRWKRSFLLGLTALACATFALSPTADDWEPAPRPAARAVIAASAACADVDPLRRPFFGDLHVHTGYSFDARSRDMISTPDDAYRFARGEAIGLGPFDPDGRGARSAQLERPLDFAAVTDHAEWIGEVNLCTTPGSASYDTDSCRGFRGEIELRSPLPGIPPNRMLGIIGLAGRKAKVCGPNAAWCRESLLSAWQITQRATERWYDRSASCSFTSFHGWEHSYSPGRSKVHRNVIFRNEIVPELPISSLEQPEAQGLWEKLDAQCNANGSGCESLSIPHNPNVSNGRLFRITWRGESLEVQKRQASRRARFEPIVEMMQVKGESECKSGMFDVVGEDELCAFEKVRGVDLARFPDCEEGIGTGALAGKGCQSRLDFVRYAITEGLREEERIGVNPYRFGFIGSTDTHNATPGDVEEYSAQGCCAKVDATPAQRLDPTPHFAGTTRAARNPGGLMGAWAEENRRDALFDAMQRRETFATSGPRIAPRFFAGWELPDGLCEGGDLAARGYAHGVPMGGELPTGRRGAGAPTFVASVLRDPGVPAHPGNLLERLQIVKVWVGDDGRFHQAVHDIAGGPEPRADVDLDTCTPRGPGHDALCAVWQDPDFDASRSAAWYVRVVENPSCRWSWRECLALPPERRPSTCDAPEIPRTIQERAWTSPIWYSPAGPV